MQPAEDRHSCKLPKAERLCSQLQIAKLIAKKQCFVCYPFKCYYDWDYQTQLPHQFVVSVPKRNFRHAVDRNHIKRLFREAYRKHKHLLPPSSESGLHFHLFFFIKPSLWRSSPVPFKIPIALLRKSGNDVGEGYFLRPIRF